MRYHNKWRLLQQILANMLGWVQVTCPDLRANYGLYASCLFYASQQRRHLPCTALAMTKRLRQAALLNRLWFVSSDNNHVATNHNQ